MRHCTPCAVEYEFENFCTSCGHELEGGRLPAALEKQRPMKQCAECGRIFRKEERFCGGCGLAFSKATAGVFRFYIGEDCVNNGSA